MVFSFDGLLPHLQALAYLLEVIAAETLFLRRFELRNGRRIRNFAGLALMLLAGTLTGIPTGSSVVRFLWYFALMLWRVVCAVNCFYGGISAVTSACMAGFATQHIANKITILFRLIPAAATALKRIPSLGILLEVLVFTGVYALIYAVFAKRIRPGAGSRRLDVLSAAIILLCIGVNRLVADTAGESVQYEAAVCIYAIIGCVFALIIQAYISRWEDERSQALIMQRLLADSEKQYEQWKNGAEQVRIAVHDIKHMLAHVQELADKQQVELPDLDKMRRTYENYAPSVRTGNDALDVLLRNMTSLCEQHEVVLNYTVYTDRLKYFDGMSIYFLFANAIDNAMKAASAVPDPEKRLISVGIRQFGSSVVIHIWNYYAGKLDFANGLPVTHGDSRVHGFGMKSIQMIVEQLGGVLNVHTQDQVFDLDVMLPLKEQDLQPRS